MFKIIKVILLYLNYINIFSIQEGIVNLNFIKKIPDLTGLTPENVIFPGLQDNEIITEINIGTQPQKIPMNINLYHYSFFIAGEFQNETQQNNIRFKQSNSISFKQYEKIGNFGGRGYTLGYKASDFFYFNFNQEKKYNISFILASDPEDGVSGTLGFKLNEEEDNEIIEYNFINQLKKAKAIKDYYFTIQYLNYTYGNIIIGDLPGNYDKKYKNLEYRDTYIVEPNSPRSWNIQFDSIYTKFSDEKNINDLGKFIGYFRIDLGVTIGSEEYRKEFMDNFMNEQIDKGICEEKFVIYYYTYYCNDNVDFSKMKNLYFFNKELNYSFEFNYKDLFFYNKLDNKYYFLIEFEKNTNKNNRWLLGEFFFKKYQLIFNQDKKKIGIYIGNNKEINQNDKQSWINKNKWYLILIISLMLLLIVIALLIYYIIKNKPRRKMKANELLDDNYDYDNPINNDSKE